jgi:hypothetical protein
MKPARAPLLSVRPTVSLSIRSCASWRCSGVNHRVVRGVSGRMKMQMTAIPIVTTPRSSVNFWLLYSTKVIMLTFNDEQPLPSMDTMLVVKRCKGRSCDQTRKSDGKDVAGIQDRHPSGNLFACIEKTQDIKCSRIERCFNDTKEQPNKEQAGVVVNAGRQSCDRTPHNHAESHVQ